MKYLLILTLLLSCASNHIQDYLPKFNRDKVCSADALEYLQANKKLKTGPKTDTDYVRSQMLKMHAMAKSCYDNELHGGGPLHHFNLCYVAGFDSEGKQEYVNFHTNEVDMPKSFYDCLYAGNKNMNFEGLKDLTVIQPFSFRPITKN